MVLGSGAYEEMAPAWSSSSSPMAHRINALPKIVFSSRLSAVEWNAELSRAPLETAVADLKREAGPDIICFGGARIANSLARHGLIDEYRLTVHPVALGAGMSLWDGLTEPQPLRIGASTVYTDGSITHLGSPAEA